jgi:hypothetical protein
MIIPWTAKRQIIYFFIFAFVVSIIVFFIWSGITKPTCFDNKQNQSEEEVDCGGPCKKECLGDVKELIVLWSRFFETSKEKYDVAALVKNPNLFLSVSSLKYQFKIYDKDNILIAVKEGETFITPGETFPIFETNVDVGLRTPGQAFIEFEKSPQWERTEKEKSSLVVSKKQFFNEPPFPRLIITLENKSVSVINNISVATAIYDKDKNAKGVSLTAVDSIAGESSQEIVFTWPRLFDEEPSSIEIFFRTGL